MTPGPHRRRPAALGVTLLLAAAAAAAAQGNGFFNQRDDQYTLLGLKRAKAAYDIARQAYDRESRLHDDRLVSDAELDAAKARLSEAEVNYQQSVLAVLFEQQYVSVRRAIKRRAGSGQRVRLEIANTSGGGAELDQLLDIDDGFFRAIRPDVVHDVYISLANDDGAIISRPYESKIESLSYGAPQTLEIELLQDLDAVTVLLTYGRGSQRAVKVFLEKDASADRVDVESEQFSQEVELGSSADFDLSLELFSGTSDTFKLEVVGLPREIDRYFHDPATEARLSQLKFAESSRTRRVELKTFLPDRAVGDLEIGRPIPFWVLAVPRERRAELGDLEGPWSDETVAALGVGSVRLELVPRGVGRLRVKAPQLFFPIDEGGVVSATVDLVNEGSRRLDNLEVTAEPPLGWTKEVAPAVVPHLEIGEEARVELTFQPPADAPVGKYEVRVRSSSFSDNQPIEGEDKTLSVEIRSRVRLAPTAILVGIMLAMILGVVIFGVRLARR